MTYIHVDYLPCSFFPDLISHGKVAGADQYQRIFTSLDYQHIRPL